MKPTSFTLAAALLACAAPASAQTVAPKAANLREVMRGDDGTTLSIDTSSVVHRPRSVYAVHRVIRFPQPVPIDGTAVDEEVDYEELDCANARSRAFLSMLFAGDSLVDMRSQPNQWERVAETRLATFRASCDALQAIGGRGFELSDVERQPELDNVPAVEALISREYPEELRKDGVTGTTTLRMRVLPNGSVEHGSISVIEESDPRFTDAARRVVMMMHFRPARVAGRPVAVWVTLPVTFTSAPERAPDHP